jgi:hypothetical protein
MVETFLWKNKEGTVRLVSLKELLNKLIEIKQTDIDEEISVNVKGNKLLKWLENNFPNELELIVNLKNIKEFTPQQIRELIVRDLRKII